jgi:hypothetical protein
MTMKKLNHLISWHHLITTPAIAITYIHIFDQTQLQSLFSCQLCQGNQLIIIVAALDHSIEFEASLRRVVPSSTSRINASQHPLQQSIPSLRARAQASHSRNTRAINGIQADRNAIHSRRAQSARLLMIEKRTIGGDSNLFQPTEGVRNRLPTNREGIKKRPKAIAEQRFTARESKRMCSQLTGRMNQPKLIACV